MICLFILLRIATANNIETIDKFSEKYAGHNFIKVIDELWEEYLSKTDKNIFLDEDERITLSNPYWYQVQKNEFYKTHFFSIKNFIDEYNTIQTTPQSRKYNGSETDTKNIRRVYENRTTHDTFADINFDHNQAIDVLMYAEGQGIKVPPKLINFDTHIDIGLGTRIENDIDISNWINEYINIGTRVESFTTIGNWINEYIKKYNVEDIYWVIPKEIRFQDAIRELLNIEVGLSQEILSQIFIFDGKTEGVLIDSKSENILNELLSTLNRLSDTNMLNITPNHKIVNIHFCTEDSLPDFSGQDVVLSIDADFFSCPESWGYSPSSENIEQAISRFLNVLSKKNIRPPITTMSLSIGYTPIENVLQIERFFEFIMNNTPQQLDLMKKYTVCEKETISRHNIYYEGI